MARKGYDRFGNPLPCRPVAEDELPNLLFLPGFEPPEEEQVLPSANRAELTDATRRPPRARKERARPTAYRFWAEVRKGDRVRVELSSLEVEDGRVVDLGVEQEKEDGILYVTNFAIVALDRGGDAKVVDNRKMERIEEEV